MNTTNASRHGTRTYQFSCRMRLWLAAVSAGPCRRCTVPGFLFRPMSQALNHVDGFTLKCTFVWHRQKHESCRQHRTRTYQIRTLSMCVCSLLASRFGSLFTGGLFLTRLCLRISKKSEGYMHEDLTASWMPSQIQLRKCLEKSAGSDSITAKRTSRQQSIRIRYPWRTLRPLTERGSIESVETLSLTGTGQRLQ